MLPGHLHFQPDQSLGFECYADADFAGGYHHDFSAWNPITDKLYSGWYIYYAGYPIIWASKLQTLVALSTTEAEYIALSNAFCDVIQDMQLMEEIMNHGFAVLFNASYMYYKVFEDNSSVFELACLPKLRPYTKYIAVCYHHFSNMCKVGR